MPTLTIHHFPKCDSLVKISYYLFIDSKIMTFSLLLLFGLHFYNTMALKKYETKRFALSCKVEVEGFTFTCSCAA